jgi:protein O-GlcNAc transferase
MFKLKPKKNKKILAQAKQILNIGASLQRKGKLDEAITYYEKAIQLNPTYAGTYNDLGNLFHDKRNIDEAIACYQKALNLNPNFTAAHYNLGDSFQDKGQLDEAIKCYQRAIELDPRFAYAYNNLAIALKDKGQIDEAIICYKKAIALNPNLVNAIYGLANALQDKGQLDEAIEYYQKALQHDSNHIRAYTNLGHVFQSRGQLDKAETYYRRAMEIKPDDLIPHQALLMLMNYNPNHNAQAIFSEHLRFAKQHAQLLRSATQHSNDCSPARRLRIGYVSPDFRKHSVAYFVEPVIASHNREHFEVFCYSNSLVIDEVTRRIQEYSDQWKTIVGMSDDNAATLIRNDKIDILIDLAGHTANNRILVFARKPSPIQVSWIGYPATTGLSTIDYKIVDNYTDPAGVTEQFYTEQLIRMPESFLCYLPDSESPEVGNLPLLETEHITFGSFNNFPKMTAKVISLWTQILKAVPGSYIVLKAKSFFDRMTRQYVTDMFAREGIEGYRIKLFSWLPSTKEHMNLYNQVDIALDTFPYNGTTTTCEALWMGVPVITLAGNSHASRVGESLLSTVGLKELVAHTCEEYIETAVTLAKDVQRLQYLRENLRNTIAKAPLTDARRFTVQLENCYHSMFEAWCQSV